MRGLEDSLPKWLTHVAAKLVLSVGNSVDMRVRFLVPFYLGSFMWNRGWVSKVNILRDRKWKLHSLK